MFDTLRSVMSAKRWRHCGVSCCWHDLTLGVSRVVKPWNKWVKTRCCWLKAFRVHFWFVRLNSADELLCTRFGVKPEEGVGAAMYFWLFLTKSVGVNENLGLRGTRGGLTPSPHLPPPPTNRALVAPVLWCSLLKSSKHHCPCTKINWNWNSYRAGNGMSTNRDRDQRARLQ